MAYNAVIDKEDFESNLELMGDKLRFINGTSAKLSWPEGFLASADAVGGEYGMRDLTVNEEGLYSGSMINNSFVNYSTVSTSQKCAFFFKRPIIAELNDVVKLVFANKTYTDVGFSSVQMIVAPFNLLDLNVNYIMTGKSTTIQTTITKNKIEIYGLLIGPRHSIAWQNLNTTLHFYVNDTQYF